MRWLVALFLVAWCHLAVAQVPMTGAGLGAPASGGASPTFTGAVSTVNTGCGFATTCPVTLTVTGGELVVFAGGTNNAGGASTISAVATSGTCGTVSLTAVETPSSPSLDWLEGLYHGTVGSGSCTITFTASAAGAFNVLGAAAGTLGNLSSTTPGSHCNGTYFASQNAPYPCTASITIVGSGFAIAGFGGASITALTSSNITIDSQANAAASSVAIGHASGAGAIIPTFTTTNFLQAGITAGAWN